MTLLESCIATLRSGPTDTLFKAIDKATADTVGHKLFTLLYVAPNGKRVKRLYTNMPKEYPVGGYKDVKDTPWHQRVVREKRAWVGRDAKDIEWAFFDHKLILSLGCESAMNVPVVYNGRLLGTMNLLDAAGHYKESDPVLCEPFAALLVGPFLDAIAADPDIGS
jgi:GAF domain-containing protein